MLYLIHIFLLCATALASDWDTYPSVPKTATVNGFADPIMNNLPQCAKSCVSFSVSNTPCPYWDTGCLCVMPQWSGQVANCFMSSCSEASDVASATSAAYSLCSSAGANVWMMPASLSTEIQKAAGGAGVAASTETGSGSGSGSAMITSSAVTAASTTTSAQNAMSSMGSTSQSSSTANEAALSQKQSLAVVLSVVVLSILA